MTFKLLVQEILKDSTLAVTHTHTHTGVFIGSDGSTYHHMTRNLTLFSHSAFELDPDFSLMLISWLNFDI